MKAFIVAIIVAAVLVLAIRPLRLQAANIGYQAGFLVFLALSKNGKKQRTITRSTQMA